MTTVPLFYYPLTVAMVDDDPLVIQALTSLLEKNYYHKSFNDVTTGLRFLKENCPLLTSMPFLRGCVEHDHYETLTSLPVDLNLQVISELRQNHLRHDEIAVLIIDYNMPKMTGLEFCEEIRDLPVKKILLTGEVEYSKAVAAFNAGLIDRFVRKDSTNLANEILLHVEALSNHYLTYATKRLVSHLEVESSLPFSDMKFAAFFKEWCKKHQVKEHYLLDKQGNLALVTTKGDTHYLIIHTDKSLDQFVELYSDNKQLSSYVKAAARREQIPFFGVGKEAWEFNDDEWKNHFYKPEKFDGEVSYYISRVEI